MPGCRGRDERLPCTHPILLKSAPCMHASRDELPELLGAAIRGSDWGDLRSTVVSMPAGTDARPCQGLPHGRCPAPHWGYVIKGQIRINLRRPRGSRARWRPSITCRRATLLWSKRLRKRGVQPTSGARTGSGRHQAQRCYGADGASLG